MKTHHVKQNEDFADARRGKDDEKFPIDSINNTDNNKIQYTKILSNSLFWMISSSVVKNVGFRPIFTLAERHGGNWLYYLHLELMCVLCVLAEFNCTLGGHGVTVNIYPSKCGAAGKRVSQIKYWHVNSPKN